MSSFLTLTSLAIPHVLFGEVFAIDLFDDFDRHRRERRNTFVTILLP
jgi:hypothetical protein